MPRPAAFAILLLAFQLSSSAGRHPALPESPVPGGVLSQLTIAGFDDSGQTSIQAMATDSSGNIYVAGTTGSPDLRVRNAAQPTFGDARILRTTDQGKTWTRVGSPPQDVNAVAVDPAAPQVLFAAGPSGIYKSANAGQAWRLVYSYGGSGSYPTNASLVIDPGNHLRLAAINPYAGGTLVISLDGGETWTATGATGSQLSADPTGSGALLVASFGRLSLSRDWGGTLQTLSVPGPGGASAAAFDPSHRGWIYAGTQGGVMGGVFLSTDFGATWTAKGSPPTIFSAIQNLAVDPGNPNALLATTADGLYLSTDGGATWKQQTGFGVPFQINMMAPFTFLSPGCAAAGTVAAVAATSIGGPVAFSGNYGAAWNTPQLTHATNLSTGPGCSVYITRQVTTDAFVARLSPGGGVLWATYLGGSDQDAPTALAVDGQGNAYVAGTTSSPDFPTTVPRIGVPGQSSAFVTRFSTDGKIAYSVLIGGEATNSANAITVDSGGNVYLAGGTSSQNFPVTSAALVPSPFNGFLAKLSHDAALAYATYLNGALRAIQVDRSGQVTIAGSGTIPGTQTPSPNFSTAFLMRLSASGSQVLASTYIQGVNQAPSALATDTLGDLYVFGAGDPGTTAGAYKAQPPLTRCTQLYAPMTDVYVMKLAAADWKPLYNAALSSPCGITPGAMVVDSTGAATLAMASDKGLPLRHPLLAGPACVYNGSFNSSALAKLSPDGSTLQFATYLDGCNAPAAAVAPDGSAYAGTSPGGLKQPAAVLRLNTSSFPALSLDAILNAFSGDSNAVAQNGLYTIAGTGFQPAVVNLGLSPSRNLPDALNGIQVSFDGVAAPVVLTGPGTVMVVAPPPTPERLRGGKIPPFTAVQLTWNGTASNLVWMPTAAAQPGLLTRYFPNLLPLSATDYITFDAYALNADGTVNDAAHPAAAGSTITLFATGMGATNPPVVPGSIAQAAGVVPVTPVWSSFDQRAITVPANPPDPASTIPGYVSAVFQVRVPVPASLSNFGPPDANGVIRAPVNLQLRLYYAAYAPPDSNVVGVYLK